MGIGRLGKHAIPGVAGRAIRKLIGTAYFHEATLLAVARLQNSVSEGRR